MRIPAAPWWNIGMTAASRRALLAVALLALAAGRAAAQERGTEKKPKSVPPKKSSSSRSASAEAERKAAAELEALKARIAQQDALIAKQDETIRALEERLAKLEALAKESEDRLKAVGRETPEQATALAPTLEERLKKLETNVSKLPEAADVVSVGDFPGSFRIPGTDAALKIGGQVRVAAVFSLDAIGTDDRFVTSSIPVLGSEEAGKGARTTLSANASRFNFDFRTPTGVGAMRAFLEAGFSGDGATLVLRHAFGQWDHWILGQTWSTFSDPEAEPYGIDNEGLNAISLFRQPQIRYTTNFGDAYTVAAAIENPAPDVTNGSGVNLIPDFVLRARWNPGKGTGSLPLLGQLGHVQLAVLLRQIRAESDIDPDQTASRGGIGLGLSGVLRTGWWAETDDIKFSLYAGKGIGRYITDLRAAGGQDAYFDTTTGEMKVLGLTAAYVGYEHDWTKTLRSTATMGWVWVNVLDDQPGDALKYTRRFSLNLAWSPISRLDLVGELLTGTRVNKDLQSGTATQIQLGSRFRF
jgi:uncharacterized coiled-coil protein SlyX